MGPGMLHGWPVLSSPPRSLLSPQEALLVALKSLPSRTLLNIAGFGADVKPLFPSSRLCSNVSAAGKSPPPAPLCPPHLLWLPAMGSGLASRGTAARPALRAGRRRCGEPVSILAGCEQTWAAPTCWQPWAGRWRSPSTTATPASSSSSPTRRQATRAGSSGWCAGRPAPSGMAPALQRSHSPLHVPWAVPTDFSICSPQSHLHQPRGCPSPIKSPNPTGFGFPCGALTRHTARAASLAIEHPCPSLPQGSPLGCLATGTGPAVAFHHLALSCRCFSFGMGPRACRRLLKGMAKVSRGRAEFLSPAERLQPKVMPAGGTGGRRGHHGV